ncbi:MAG TPA: SRPBCC domain-containing protein [Acidimicrobiales bacterium]|nr:SRPBCC domain-containing protein [Acidimicrobiales bacterium]
MQITVDKDPAAHTMTVTTELDATVERAWQLWADPRQLERWWGPPTHPATVVEHDLAPGRTVRYFMTSPEGDKYHGLWEIVAVEAPKRLELVDCFADDSGAKNEDLPATRMTVTLAERDGGGTVMTMHSRFPSLEAMEQLVTMGMEEGLQQALSQIEGILAGAA